MAKNLNLKPRGIVTVYTSGVFEVVKIQLRYASKHGTCEYEENENSLHRIGDLITYKKLYDGNLKPVRSKTFNQCDSAFCVKISDTALEQIEELERKIEFYKQFIPKNE
jgi:hypothetical protein